MPIEDIRKRIKKFSLEQLREIKELIADEISERNREHGNSTLNSRLYCILSDGSYGYYRTSFEERLKDISELTEAEFSKYRGVGKLVLAEAKRELNKIGLEFKK